MHTRSYKQKYCGSEIYDPRSGMGLSEDKNNVEVLQRMKIISAHTPVFGRSLGGAPIAICNDAEISIW